ncbi:MAG: helix-turn-helix domain-containing protein [Pseudomonadota bacterium]
MTQARVSITPSDAWADQRLTPLQCRLLGLIGSYLGKDHRAWPSQSTLADQLGVSRKAVNDGVKALKKYGYVQVEKRVREDGGQTSNCYFVLMDPRSRGGDTPSEASVTPLSPQGDTPCNPIEVTPPVTPEGDTHKKDPIERPNEDTVCFEDAWKAYNRSPKKAHQKKVPAQKAWAKAIKKADPEIILKAIEREVEDRINPRGWIGSLPDMHRWLRDEGWQDVNFPEQAPAPEPTRQDWEQWANHLSTFGEWLPGSVPAPGHPDCKIPKDLLETIPHDLRRAA